MKLFSTPTSDEWLFLGIIFILVAMMIAAGEISRRLLSGSTKYTRKLVHIITGVLMACAPYVLISGIPALMISGLMVIGTFLSIRFGFLKSLHGSDRSSYGTTYHPLSFLILVFLFWDSSPEILSISILILAIPDVLAAIAGQYFSSPHYLFLGDNKKTIEGSITMFVSTMVCIMLSLRYFGIETAVPMVLVAIATSLFVTCWELISYRGTDNLTVPLGTALMLHYFITAAPNHIPVQMITAIILACVIGIASYYFKFLSLSGSIAAFLLATIIYGIGGWKWTIPIFTFFVASSLLSKYGKSRKKKFKFIFDKSDKRDAGQVAANGGIAGIIMIAWYLFPARTDLYLLYVASLAAVTADTWGTEIGTLVQGKPRSITSFRHVEPGTSGGVSIAGTIGGIVGAVIVVVSVFMVDTDLFSANDIALLVFSGFVGSAADSFLGATIQAQYQTEKGELTEKSNLFGKPTILVHGYRWMSNDAVNWSCALSGALTMYFLL